ncbi:MAG: DUF4145 domain-containing protein [Vicinamibacterales bacterium]
MQRLNVVGLHTRHGFRTCELYQGDLAALDRRVDALVVSAFAGDCEKTPGSVIGSLWERCGIDVNALAQDPELDFRESLGVWCSRPLADQQFARIVCADIVGSTLTVAEVLENVFVGLTVLEAKQTPVSRVALPVLGAGYQRVSPAVAARELIMATRRYLDRSATAESVLFVEIDAGRAAELTQAMDMALGRESAILVPTQLVDSVRADLADAFRHADSLFESDVSGLRDDWQRLLDSPVVRTAELGLLGRRLVEMLVTRLGGNKAGHLHQRIRALEEQGRIAPWICGYMHVLRHLGNEAAHERGPRRAYRLLSIRVT